MISTRPRLVSLARPYLRDTDVAAVRRYQSANDLVADGMVGIRTRRSLGLRI